MALLEIQNLSVDFKTAGGLFRAVDRVSLSLEPQEILAVVGESGSGKSVSMLALMGLLPWTAKVQADKMTYQGQDLLAMKPRQRRSIIGKEIAMIFQEPMTSLNPCFSVAFQLEEVLKEHTPLNKAQRKARMLELLDLVGIPDPKKRLEAFPHQLSGGMSQRIMIAMAIACNPKVLIADEPTTALDVTIQAQILELLMSLQSETGMALVLITHDMGVVAEMAHRVVVQYAGEQVEHQGVKELFQTPKHPYTQALLAALPERASSDKLSAIAGTVPGQYDKPQGCLFAPRCQHVQSICHGTPPKRASKEQGRALCHFPISYSS